MCDGCDAFFRDKKGVIRAAAVANVNRFTQVSDLISDIQYRVLPWKPRTDDYIGVSDGFLFDVYSISNYIFCSFDLSSLESF